MTTVLQRETTGLLVVDVQGKLARLMHHSDSVIQRCAALIQGAQRLNLPIIWLEQEADKLGGTVPELAQLLINEPRVQKTHFSACGEADFGAVLAAAGASQWLVCGIESHICVYQTVMGMLARGLHVQVVSDAVSSRQAEQISLALNKMVRAGAELTSVEMCLFELLQDCRCPEFRDVLKLIK